MKWDKLRVTREDCSIVKNRMVRCGLPLYGQPDSAAGWAGDGCGQSDGRMGTVARAGCGSA